MGLNELVAPAIAFSLTLLLLYWLRPLAHRVGLIDRPSQRRAHDGSVPLTGGVAMFFGFAIAVLTLPVGLTALRPFFAASAILVLIGLLDDLRELSSRARFAAQILAAVIMVWWGDVVLYDLGLIGPNEDLLRLSGLEFVFSVFCTVGVINALNMVDGLDGLAGLLALVVLLGLSWLAHRAGAVAERDVLVVLAAACVAFLCVNVRIPGRARALAFMGDAGSMFIGFAITWFVIHLSQGSDRAMAPVTALWLLLVPLFDAVWLLIKRPLTGRAPTAAAQEHFHHVLQMAGASVPVTLLIITGVAVTAAGVGVWAETAGYSERWMFVVFLALFAAYCAVMGVTAATRRLLLWPLDRRTAEGHRRANAERRERTRRRAADRRGDTAGRGRRESD